ncbi:MAG TPA: DUF72 domain-containing protein [Candidatus Aenigmarchaeota archaeon]|nr:DUF72 domain-containing protein [Candidatus Aenigmarchaeota archaeon]
MRIYVGTSGFAYSWNPDGLEWYMKNSTLNTLELNSSFYRFPFPNQVKSWARKTKEMNPDLRWSIKVNRLITHVFKLSERALLTWKKFERLFKPLNESIDFYLFQLPPSATPNMAERIESFFKKVKLNERFALEWRNIKWFSDEWVEWAKKLGLTLVSVDAPDLPGDVFNTSGAVYVRMHGRIFWYAHYYTNDELYEVAEKIVATKPKRVYVYFNNNTNMLENARRMLNLFRNTITE